ncbi:MAG: hypothetical protein IIY36_00150, partial [Lachnospiraceae bacterium]|nr:hypothetical protein [Lachnospiraceae bacterium]
MGLIMGVDLCDDYSQVSWFDKKIMDAVQAGTSEKEESCLIPSVVCRRKKTDDWLIGEDAYLLALDGEGTMVDKPVKLLEKKGTATIRRVKYTASDIMRIFLEKLINLAKARSGETEIESLVITLQDTLPEVLDAMIGITDSLGIAREAVHIINHCEAYMFYVLSQKKEIWANNTCLFDLNANDLFYYEFSVMRGRKPQLVQVSGMPLEEGFSLEVLDTESGEKTADTILTTCAGRLLDKKIITTVFLTGKGFERTDWAPEFLRTVCQKRRVFYGQNLFAKGAAFLAYDTTLPQTSFPYVCVCEGRIPSTISMRVLYEGRERQLVVLSAGTNWYEAKS